MAGLTEIEGIGDVLAAQFTAAGVNGTAALLRKGGTKAGRNALVAATGIDESRVLRFVNHADLMRIKGVGGEYSELLEAAGVDSVPELAQRNADNLHSRLVSANAEKKLVRNVPGLKSVRNWVAQAGTMDRVIRH